MIVNGIKRMNHSFTNYEVETPRSLPALIIKRNRLEKRRFWLTIGLVAFAVAVATFSLTS